MSRVDCLEQRRLIRTVLGVDVSIVFQQKRDDVSVSSDGSMRQKASIISAVLKYIDSIHVYNKISNKIRKVSKTYLQTKTIIKNLMNQVWKRELSASFSVYSHVLG